MKKTFAFLCFGFLLALLVSAQTRDTRQEAFALTHVTVIDTAGGPTEPDMTVVIRGDRIAAVGKSGKIRVPAGSRVVDASGKFLIPGLWDMSVFWYDQKDYLPLFIANGVTGVRVMLGYPEHYEMRKEIEAGELLGPRMVIATRWVQGAKDTDPWSIPVGNEVEARQAVVNAQKFSADFIGFGGGLDPPPREAFFAIADEAKKRGIPFEGAVPVFVSVEEASNAGMKSIDSRAVFDEGTLVACSSREADLLKSWQEAFANAHGSDEPFDAFTKGPGFRGRMQLALETYDRQKAKALFALLRANHTSVSPTLIGRRNRAFSDDPAISGDLRLNYISARERSWMKQDNDSRSKTWSAEDNSVWKRLYQKNFEIVGGMRRAGVQLLAGTTTEEPTFTVPGFSLHDELALLVQAGLTPLEALQAATLNPARFLGRERDFGTVAPGKMADLVLLEANPLEHISNTRKIAAVVYRGKLFPRASLDAMLAKIEALASRKSIGDLLKPIIKEKGMEAAIRKYRELRSTQRDSYDFGDKRELGGLGVALLYTEKFREAIQILELNAEAFPRWWRAYDELGEAYMGAGEKELAINSFKKSLQLDPTNASATALLKQLNSQ